MCVRRNVTGYSTGGLPSALKQRELHKAQGERFDGHESQLEAVLEPLARFTGEPDVAKQGQKSKEKDKNEKTEKAPKTEQVQSRPIGLRVSFFSNESKGISQNCKPVDLENYVGMDWNKNTCLVGKADLQADMSTENEIHEV